jgi:hypothetical protein
MLDERRLIELKRLAAERGQTISAVVDEFLAEGIRRAATPRQENPLPDFEMGKPKVNVANRSQLGEAIEREWGS